MDIPNYVGTLININTDTTNLANIPNLIEFNPNDNKALVLDDTDDSRTTINVTRHFQSIRARDKSSISPIYLPGIYKPAPWEVSVAFFLNYLPRINLDLEGLLYVDMEKIE